MIYPLVATAGPGEVNSLGFTSVQVINLTGTNPAGIMPGDLLILSCTGSPAANTAQIGVRFPWDLPPAPMLMASIVSGNLTLGPIACDAPSGPVLPNGLLISTGVTGGSMGPFGGYTCAYFAPTAPPAPDSPSFASFIAVVENSWNTHVPVVDPFNPNSWNTGEAYISASQFPPGPVTVDYAGFGSGTPAASSSAASTIATAMGGAVSMAVPPQSVYAAYYDDPGAVAGSLQPVPYITAQVPLGPNGALVPGTALAAAILNAMVYGRQTGFQAAVLACFSPAA